MDRLVGHRYRGFFSLLCWAAMLYLFLAGRSGMVFAAHPVSRYILASALLLTMSFTIFTLVIWLADRRHPSHKAEGPE
jgi:hypothetical protein